MERMLAGPARQDDYDFQWTGDDADAVVVQARRAIAVYENPCGKIVLRQQPPTEEWEPDPVIVIDRESVIAIANALLRAVGKDETMVPHTDPTASTRMRRYRAKKRNETVTARNIPVTSRGESELEKEVTPDFFDEGRVAIAEGEGGT